jgi:hypothetical protein
MDELKIVEEIEPALAPNVHDALDFMGVFWAVETARAEATLMAEPSATTAPTQKPTLTPTPEPSTPSQPRPLEPMPPAATGGGQRMILGVTAIVIVLVILGFLVFKRLRGSAG